MASVSETTTAATTSAEHHHDDHHHELSFWRKYVFSTDHKVIGIQYLISGLVFLFFGFLLVSVMRWSIAYPQDSIPFFGTFFGDKWAPGGILNPDFYNMLGAMHGTIMVFLGIVPIGFAAFGNYVMPLQLGAPDMAFPKLNMMSFWLFLVGGLLMMASFFLPLGAVKTGWTMYSPLASTYEAGLVSPWLAGHTWWILAMVLIITSSLLGAVNFITTIINLRAKGLTWMRMPFFCWAMLVTAFILLLAFPPLEAAALMQLLDRVAGTSFFLPSGLNIGDQNLDISGGGSPLLYQHLFWFLGHPEVYVLILPAFAIVAEILPNNTRRPLWGYKSMVYAALAIGFLSFIVWAHHMYLTGMGSVVTTFFQTTTVLISVPSVILLTALIISLWGGSIRFNMPMIWALTFIPMFGIGGLTGLPLAFTFLDLQLHDTYYVIGHFHYVIAPGVIFAFFAGVYYWFPKVTGREMNTVLGHLHFWPTLIAMNVIFMPMFVQGMAGFHRRWYDGGAAYSKLSEKYLYLNEVMSAATWLMALVQIFFIINFVWSIFGGRKVNSDNPWRATTLEWATPTPPPHGNFAQEPIVYRGPYEYSVPGHAEDYSPQNVAVPAPVQEEAPSQS